MIKVFKFGGASLADADQIKQVGALIETHAQGNLLVVVSAMGKTTNALERILDLSVSNASIAVPFNEVKEYHRSLITPLFPQGHVVFEKVAHLFSQAESALQGKEEYHCLYDQFVSWGELVSSTILHHYLLHKGLPNTWIDAREYICTDATFREGKVDWERSEKKMSPLKKSPSPLTITQGFIARAADGRTTTLGRDGSDYSAGIFASCLNAQSVTIWKDVPGVMNADPKRIQTALVFDELPYRETAEMTYYGASIIHPKTIRPLANKNIPLFVKNFNDPSLPGTKIHDCTVEHLHPLIVFKDNQCLVSCRVTDYTFINETQLGIIFNILSQLDIKVNVMQNSAISFSFCTDFREDKIMKLIEALKGHFEVFYNLNLTLITIKNYNRETYDAYRKHPHILLEQSSRSTLQVLVKNP